MPKQKKQILPNNEKLIDEKTGQKFKFVLPNHHENVYLTIDDKQHNFNKNQFHALTKAVLNIYQKMNPEIDIVDLL